jgi:hypothetical protein
MTHVCKKNNYDVSKSAYFSLQAKERVLILGLHAHLKGPQSVNYFLLWAGNRMSYRNFPACPYTNRKTLRWKFSREDEKSLSRIFCVVINISCFIRKAISLRCVLWINRGRTPHPIIYGLSIDFYDTAIDMIYKYLYPYKIKRTSYVQVPPPINLSVT